MGQALLALVLLPVSMAFGKFADPVLATVGLTLLDSTAIYMPFFAEKPSLGKAKGSLSRAYRLMFPVGEALAIVAMVSPIATLIADVAMLGDLTGYR